MKRAALILLIAVVVTWGVIGLVLVSQPAGEATGALVSSGTLEARQVNLVAEVSGQIARLTLHEGDQVQAGAILVELDTAFQDAQVARAKAAVDAAQASLALVKAGSRTEQKDQARAALDREIAIRDGAARGVKNLQSVLENPQELDAQIAQVVAQLKAADAAIIQSQNQRHAAEITRDRYQGESSLDGRAQFQAAEAQLRAADSGIIAAQANRDGAQTAANLLQAMRANPISLKSELHAAQARLNQADAAVLMARSTVDSLLAGPRPQEVALAQAQADQAQAALEQLQVQRDKMTLRAPAAGVVTSLPVRSGENVQPGAKLLTLADLQSIQLTLYVPETQIGHVRVGQLVRVTVDGLPGRVFEGAVYFISPRAEFTPASVQTKEERAKTVFLVRVRLPNPQLELKPGMPADATLEGG
jgi:HlyD family secretion protein